MHHLLPLHRLRLHPYILTPLPPQHPVAVTPLLRQHGVVRGKTRRRMSRMVTRSADSVLWKNFDDLGDGTVGVDRPPLLRNLLPLGNLRPILLRLLLVYLWTRGHLLRPFRLRAILIHLMLPHPFRILHRFTHLIAMPSNPHSVVRCLNSSSFRSSVVSSSLFNHARSHMVISETATLSPLPPFIVHL